MKIHLIVIDPQNSFCKVVDPSQQQTQHNGELCVTGGWDDMVRLAGLVNRLGEKINDITCTLDSHHRLHIAHAMFWKRQDNGQRPDPFTFLREDNGRIIGSDLQGNDVGEFTTIIPSFMKKAVPYLRKIRENGRYTHTVWPDHCLIGTPGHNVVEPIMKEFLEWEQKGRPGYVQFVTKGSHIFTEHFGAVRAEVPDPEVPETGLNRDFIDTVMDADQILLSGEARSHCLANTVRDIANEFTATDEFIKKCILLTDATSDVPGLEKLGEDFVQEMTSRGMKATTCGDYLT